MYSKIDSNLMDIMIQSKNDKLIDCLIYVDNFDIMKAYLNKIKKSFNIKRIVPFEFVSMFGITMSNKKILDFAKHRNVTFVTKASKVTALCDVSRKLLKVDELHNAGYYGEGITIAYIDTGIQKHLDFVLGKNRIVEFVDVINKKTKPYDDNGHGTFVSGVGSGNGLISNRKYMGIAPKTKIIMLKALSNTGDASAISILEAMDWIYNNTDKYNIKVVCMSFGSSPLAVNDSIVYGAEKLWTKGVLVVAAAGNSGPEYETVTSPGISSRVITVGGLDDKRSENCNLDKKKFDIADFSSRGPAFRRIKPDLVAPSVDIVSCSRSEKKFYEKLNGTSVATPMIAGMCALFYERYPKANLNFIKKKLMSSCVPLTYNKNFEGAGYPDGKVFLYY